MSSQGFAAVDVSNLEAMSGRVLRDTWPDVQRYIREFSGDVAPFEGLLRRGMLVDIAPFGQTMLHMACSQGSARLVDFMVINGADLHAASASSNDRSLLPIEIAAALGHAEVVALLLSAGSHHGRALHLAASHGHSDVVALLHADGASIDVTLQGWSPLILAASQHHEPCAQALVGLGADVRRPLGAPARDALKLPEGATPAHVAAALGLERVVAAMLQQHPTLLADCGGGNGSGAGSAAAAAAAARTDSASEQQGRAGSSAKARAVAPPSLVSVATPSVRPVISPAYAATWAFMRKPMPSAAGDAAALAAAYRAELSTLLQSTADPNACDGRGVTLLMAAALGDDVATAALLLDRGADPALATRSGVTAMMWAEAAQAAGVLTLLHGRGVVLTAKDEAALKALAYARRANANDAHALDILSFKGLAGADFVFSELADDAALTARLEVGRCLVDGFVLVM